MEQLSEEVCLSVIIPSYNNSKQLNELLNSILSQKISDIEIIVVDDGSTIPLQINFDNKRLNIFRIENQGPSIARNYGASKAKGKYFLFLDSDVRLESNMLAKILEICKGDKYEVISIYYSETPANKGIAQKFKALFDYYYLVHTNKNKYVYNLHGSSCIFKAETFFKMKGWNSEFKKASLENEEFAARLINSNIKIYSDSQLKVLHNFPGIFKLLKLIFLRSMVWTQLKIKNNVKFDKTVRTPISALISLISLFLITSLLLTPYSNYFVYLFVFLLTIYLIGNFGFYYYIYRRLKFFEFTIILFYNLFFHISVSTGAILGLILFKFIEIKK